MIQYQCNNITQVAKKVAQLTNTIPDKEFWKFYCNKLKKNKDTSDVIDYIDGNGNDINIFFGWDGEYWYIGIEEL